MEHSHIRARRRGTDAPEDKFRATRQWLNIIFMLGAIVGVVVFLSCDRTTGTLIILAAMVFKIIECALRFIH